MPVLVAPPRWGVLCWHAVRRHGWACCAGVFFLPSWLGVLCSCWALLAGWAHCVDAWLSSFSGYVVPVFGPRDFSHPKSVLQSLALGPCHMHKHPYLNLDWWSLVLSVRPYLFMRYVQVRRWQRSSFCCLPWAPAPHGSIEPPVGSASHPVSRGPAFVRPCVTGVVLPPAGALRSGGGFVLVWDVLAMTIKVAPIGFSDLPLWRCFHGGAEPRCAPPWVSPLRAGLWYVT